MTLYTVVETAIIGLIGVISAYHVMKMLMPGMINRARLSVALRLGRGANATSWRQCLAGSVRDTVPRTGCGAGCGDGCNGCAVAASASTLARVDDQTPR